MALAPRVHSVPELVLNTWSPQHRSMAQAQHTYAVWRMQAFKGFDITIAEAAKQNIRLVVALTNNWNYNPLQTDWK